MPLPKELRDHFYKKQPKAVTLSCCEKGHTLIAYPTKGCPLCKAVKNTGIHKQENEWLQRKILRAAKRHGIIYAEYTNLVHKASTICPEILI